MEREEVGRRLVQIAKEALDEDFECPDPRVRGMEHVCLHNCYQRFLREKNGA
jgi:hypothetical protein